MCMAFTGDQVSSSGDLDSLQESPEATAFRILAFSLVTCPASIPLQIHLDHLGLSPASVILNIRLLKPW